MKTSYLLLALLAAVTHAQVPIHYQPTVASLDQHPLPQWYADAKLGIFVHRSPIHPLKGAVPQCLFP